ncbi:hypothetical protein D0T84_05355 [Dysgonomonas sp. 521]|uniref:major capsid protein n=1 Tax=Dysgonomonas sp. 521 TaxID=2302932 RepID=UPI0013D3AB16|nr:major capsid protein [Dysgonomonas sp. 521]NDV94345.1 hypothetical protein [Dysgonomonas sp. 521]
MSITKTIGGDRIGSGNKMKQSMHNYERSNHALDYVWRSSMTAGTLVPFMCELMLPGDTFDIDLTDNQVLTHPTVGPLFGSFKLQLDVYLVPIRLYQAQLHNNKLGIGMKMNTIKLPQLKIQANNIDWESEKEPIDVQQINPSSLLAYLGIRGIGYANDEDSDNGLITAEFNAIPYLAYWDIYKNYYANKQEEIGMMVAPAPMTDRITQVIISNPVTGDSVKLPSTNGVLFFQSTEVGFYNTMTITPIIEGDTFDVDNIMIVAKENFPQSNSNITDLATLTARYGTLVKEQVGTDRECTKLVVEKHGIGNIGGYHILNVGLMNEISEIMLEGENIEIKSFPLENIDNMREDILAAIKNTEPFKIDYQTYAPYGTPLNLIKTEEDDVKGYKVRSASYTAMSGLAIKTYQSDLYNNWLSSEFIDGVNGVAELSAIDISDGMLRMDALNLAQKVYNMLNRIAVSGGTYYDYIETVYGQKVHGMSETPIYQGGLSQEVIFQEVVSNSASEGAPLGSLAGKGILSRQVKGGKIVMSSPSEPCYAIGIVSLTPRLDYSQGNKWDVNLKTMDNLHKPALDTIGFQDLITEQMAAWDVRRDKNGNPTYKSAGKVPAWINYMTNVNQCYGTFARENNEMWMTLNRNYQPDPELKTIKDLTTYIDPTKFNHTFAVEELAAQNFWVQINVDIKARRKVSARQIPNL